MELDPKDHTLVKLLTRMKKVNTDYPPRLLKSRRESYLRQMANIGLGTGAAAHLKNSLKRGGGSANGASSAGALLETVLVIAIVAEAATAAYFYRDKLAILIQSSISPTQVDVVNQPERIFLQPTITSLISSESPTSIESETPTGTVIGTPVAGSAAITEAAATANPNGNNGNHYGQTPKPERTKKPGNDSNPQNNKPPKPNKKP